MSDGHPRRSAGPSDSSTGCDLLPDTVVRLSAIDNIVGIKEAIGSLPRATELIARTGFDEQATQAHALYQEMLAVVRKPRRPFSRMEREAPLTPTRTDAGRVGPTATAGRRGASRS